MVKRVSLPSSDRLHELLSYDEKSGILKWRKMGSGVNADMIAGIHGHGYIVVRISGTLYQAHRIIWKMMTGNEPPDFIDHKDCNRVNNAWGNLREASNGQNMMNAPISRQNTSGAKGVYWHKGAQKWMASIKVQGRSHYFGLYETFDEAFEVVARKRQSLHGEFARMR